MKLIAQPEDGVAPLIKHIDSAKQSIEIAIFRFDHVEIQSALERAVERGVSVHALIANTNHGDENKCLDLASSIYKKFKHETKSPMNLETIRLI